MQTLQERQHVLVLVLLLYEVLRMYLLFTPCVVGAMSCDVLLYEVSTSVYCCVCVYFHCLSLVSRSLDVVDYSR